MSWPDLFVVAFGVAGYFAAVMLAGVVVGRYRRPGPVEDVEARRQERDAEQALYPHASSRRR